MQLIEYGGLKIAVDDEGYLARSEDWNDKVACALAEHEGVDELTEDRLALIRFMRDYYKQYNFFPILRAVCKNVQQSKNCFSEQFLDPLTAWKIAGLPKPDEHVIADLRGEGGVV
ncbi:MAG TPA: TusE/DsrC/DsvC family sulfur relay protein [Dissulfurispiraceae bacterium]|nr:TusE/DsrC/DsvC family sulfur relay protein [Dissulfurispiraceae bacterium]